MRGVNNRRGEYIMDYEQCVKVMDSITAILRMDHLSDEDKIQRIEGIINVVMKQLEQLSKED
jgi:hypothetical protein